MIVDDGLEVPTSTKPIGVVDAVLAPGRAVHGWQKRAENVMPKATSGCRDLSSLMMRLMKDGYFDVYHSSIKRGARCNATALKRDIENLVSLTSVGNESLVW